MARILQEHITEVGMKLVQQRETEVLSGAKESASDPSFVRSLLDLHARFAQLVRMQFNGNTEFQCALRDAFEVFINKDTKTKFSTLELICHFCDRMLKSGGYV